MLTRSLLPVVKALCNCGISNQSASPESLAYHFAALTPLVLRTLIQTFSLANLTSLPKSSDTAPALGCAVTALVQSPAIDVVGIGFSSGEISVYDVRLDARLMRMFMEGGVRALGFRSGVFTWCLCLHSCSKTSLDGHPILASASSAGHIALWDLNNGGRLLHMVRGAHDCVITAVEWIPGQPS
jgi:U3 small nucleolar RNA-associated protein 21